MSISFNEIPVNLLTPGQYVEFDNSKAVGGLVNETARILLFAPKLATGKAEANKAVQVTNAAEGVTLCGLGSVGAAMLSAVFSVTRTIETWLIPIEDPTGGTAAKGTVTVAGSAIDAGTISLYVAGTRLQIGATVGQTAAETAKAIAAAVNEAAELPVTAEASEGVVTLTARHKGTIGNDIDVRTNFYAGEKDVAGLAVTCKPLSGGAGAPDIAEAISLLDEKQYNTMIAPWTDGPVLKSLETELDKRWGPLCQNDGHLHVAFRGTVGEINEKLAQSNNPHVTMWTAEKDGEPEPVYLKAALAGAVCAYNLDIDPARPVQTLVLTGRLPAPVDKRFTREERNNILSYGGATTKVDAGGNVIIERAVTTYTKNPSTGITDPSYRDIETMATLSRLRYQVRARIALRYPRVKLAGDDTEIPPGQAMVTPKLIKAELVALHSDWVQAGLVEDVESFKDELIVERNASDVNRVDVLLPPNLVNQLRVFAAKIEFRL